VYMMLFRYQYMTLIYYIVIVLLIKTSVQFEIHTSKKKVVENKCAFYLQ